MNGSVALPATPATVWVYLGDHETRLSISTLIRRLSAIAVLHRTAGFPLDTRYPAISDVMRRLRIRHGSAQRHAEALTIPRLQQILAPLGDSSGRETPLEPFQPRRNGPPSRPIGFERSL